MEFGPDFLDISVPQSCVELSMKDVPVLADPGAEIQKALSHPIHSPTLGRLSEKRRSPRENSPWLSRFRTSHGLSRIEGKREFLFRFLDGLSLPASGGRTSRIIVGTGTHRPSTPEEKVTMFGEAVVKEYFITDHVCEDLDSLTYIGKTRRGTKVYLNTLFHSADIRIATGLVESHFMTGVSGGRKGDLPGSGGQTNHREIPQPGVP